MLTTTTMQSPPNKNSQISGPIKKYAIGITAAGAMIRMMVFRTTAGQLRGQYCKPKSANGSSIGKPRNTAAAHTSKFFGFASTSIAGTWKNAPYPQLNANAIA
jgi:hypothetical protein